MNKRTERRAVDLLLLGEGRSIAYYITRKCTFEFPRRYFNPTCPLHVLCSRLNANCNVGCLGIACEAVTLVAESEDEIEERE
jgi:hypothetical protein